MAKQVFTGARVWAGKQDFSGSANAATVSVAADELEATVLLDDTHEFVGGLRTGAISVAGYWDDTAVDPDAFSAIGSSLPLTVSTAAAVGSTAFNLAALEAEYSFGDQVGALCPFEVRGAAGSSGVGRGLLAANGAVTATGNGTAVQVGAVPAGKKLIVTLHVTAASGTPNLTVAVQSDNAGGFASPTTVGTFTAMTGVGSQVLVIDGPITDNYFRLSYTMSGGTPSMTIAAAIGISA